MGINYEVDVRRINSAKLKGVATVTIEGLMQIDGFKIIEGSNGLFVSVPSHKGTIVEDGVKVEKYFDDVRFPTDEGKEFAVELKDTILAAFNGSSPSQEQTTTQSTAVKKRQESAPPQKRQNSSAPPRSRKPLWKV